MAVARCGSFSTDTHRLSASPDMTKRRGKPGPASSEAGVERYTTYPLGGMRDPPSASRLAYRVSPASDILRCAPGP